MQRKKWKKLTQWRVDKSLYVLIGLAGVDPHERKRIRHVGRAFSYVSVFVAIVLLMQWQLELLGELALYQQHIINGFVWGYFIASYLLLLFSVKKKRIFVAQNWLLPIIISLGFVVTFHIMPFVIVLNALRPFFAILILIPSLTLLMNFFVDGRLSTTLLAATIIVIVFGVLVAGVDPNIKTAWDGIWWAVATVSTVGYGDVVPASALGRMIGAGLVVMGLGVFVVITANFLGLTFRKEAEKMREEEREVTQVVRDMKLLRENQKKILEQLELITKKKSK